MNSILETIRPIRLLSGHHSDTGSTGQGCIMDVASYLAGDAIVTDSPSCVDRAFHYGWRTINDLSGNEQRQTLLPYIERLIGTATDDEAVHQARRKQFRELQFGVESIIDQARNQLGFDLAPMEYGQYLHIKRPELTGKAPIAFLPARVSAQMAYGLLWLRWTVIHANASRQYGVGASGEECYSKLLEFATNSLIAMLPGQSVEATPEMVARGRKLVEAAKDNHVVSSSL